VHGKRTLIIFVHVFIVTNDVLVSQLVLERVYSRTLFSELLSPTGVYFYLASSAMIEEVKAMCDSNGDFRLFLFRFEGFLEA